MVLMKNTGSKPAQLAWEAWNYFIPEGGTLLMPNNAARALQRRIPECVPVEVEVKPLEVEEPVNFNEESSEGSDLGEPEKPEDEELMSDPPRARGNPVRVKKKRK